MSEETSSAMRQRLMTADEVYVYKIPPMKSAGGHRAEDWNLADPLKTCSLVVERREDVLVLEFYADGGIFAQSQLDVSKGGTTAQLLEQCVDTSRYFAVKIQGAGGREALIGFGFRDRDQATDLRESLQHYEKSIQRESEAHDSVGNYHVPQLAEGEKIHVGMKTGKTRVVKAGTNIKKTGAVPLLKKPPSSEDDSSATTQQLERISVSMEGIDLNAGIGDATSDEESCVAVFDGEDDQWKIE